MSTAQAPPYLSSKTTIADNNSLRNDTQEPIMYRIDNATGPDQLTALILQVAARIFTVSIRIVIPSGRLARIIA